MLLGLISKLYCNSLKIFFFQKIIILLFCFYDKVNGRSNLEEGAHVSQFAAEGDRVLSGRENRMKLERVVGTLSSLMAQERERPIVGLTIQFKSLSHSDTLPVAQPSPQRFHHLPKQHHHLVTNCLITGDCEELFMSKSQLWSTDLSIYIKCNVGTSF